MPTCWGFALPLGGARGASGGEVAKFATLVALRIGGGSAGTFAFAFAFGDALAFAECIDVCIVFGAVLAPLVPLLPVLALLMKLTYVHWVSSGFFRQFFKTPLL